MFYTLKSTSQLSTTTLHESMRARTFSEKFNKSIKHNYMRT